MKVQFYFSPMSVYSYLAGTQLKQIAKETGATFDWIPLNVDKLNEKRVRPRPPADPTVHNQYSPAYILRDVHRWAKLYNVPLFEVHDRLPVNAEVMVTACTAARVMGASDLFGAELMRMLHGTEMRLIAEKECLDAAARIGLPREVFRVCMHDTRTTQAHEAAIVEAQAFDVFDVPAFTAGTELFWGNDRLPLLRDHLFKLAAAE